MEYLSTLTQSLKPQAWATVGRTLLTKMIAEFLYEEILQPDVIETQGDFTHYQLSLPEGIAYRFQAKSRLFDSYQVRPDSLRRWDGSQWAAATNPLQFVLDIHTAVGMTAETTAHLIKELSNTLLADAHIQTAKAARQTDLTATDYAHLEGEMEGHPWITFNKGRIGFGYDDYLKHAPERQEPVNLFWIAVRRDRAQFQCISTLAYDTLIREELGADFAQFTAVLEARSLDPANYYFCPVQDWQWHNTLIP
ncbi:MAG TPA: IucA/IucC family protein, partial [Trichocoleus sp.]